MTLQNPTADDLRVIARNLRSEGSTSRADVLDNTAAELTALREALEAAKAYIEVNSWSAWIRYQEALKAIHD